MSRGNSSGSRPRDSLYSYSHATVNGAAYLGYDMPRIQSLISGSAMLQYGEAVKSRNTDYGKQHLIVALVLSERASYYHRS